MSVSVETFITGPDGEAQKYTPVMFANPRGATRRVKGEPLTAEQKAHRRNVRKTRANRAVDGFSILSALLATEEPKLSLSELRAKSGNRGADTRLIHSTMNWLLAQGLVVEERDGRAIWYALSEAGHEFVTSNSRPQHGGHVHAAEIAQAAQPA